MPVVSRLNKKRYDKLCSITEQFRIQKVGEDLGLHPAEQHSTGACLGDYVSG